MYDTDNTGQKPGWYKGSTMVMSDIQNVLIENSFAKARPTSTKYWFCGCDKLTEIVGLENLNTSNVNDMGNMFSYCRKLPSIDVSHFVTDKVTDMSMMFIGCEKLISLDIKNFNTSNVIDLSFMFNSCSSLTSLDLKNFDTSNVTNMAGMFGGCSSLTSLDLKNFDTSNVTNMAGMFGGCSSLTSLDLKNFDTSNVTNMAMMFGNSVLGSVNFENLDLSWINTSNVTNMSNMFGGCTGLTNEHLSHLNTEKVTDMSWMFCNTKINEKTLDLHVFNTKNVTNMSSMFNECEVETLDISSFNTENVIKMDAMFDFGISNIILGKDFNTNNIERSLLFRVSHMYNLKAITFTGDLPKLYEKTFAYVGTMTEPVNLIVPDEYMANYAEKIDATGKFYGGFFNLVGYTQNNTDEFDPDGFVPAPNWGGKKLLSITRMKGNYQSRGEFKYDEEGRLAQYSYGDGSIAYNFSYTGNRMDINDNGRSFSYIISDGHMTSGRIGMEYGEDLIVKPEYDSEWRWQKVSRYNTNTNMYSVGEWNGDNLVSIINYENESENINVTFDYTSDPAPYFLQSLMINSDFGAPIALNNVGVALGICLYIGQMPPYLISSAKMVKKGRTTEYPYTYEKNADGDITSFTMGDYTYVLEWDKESSDIKIVGANEDSKKFFSLDGKSQNELQKGVNIVRMSNGQVRKIVMK